MKKEVKKFSFPEKQSLSTKLKIFSKAGKERTIFPEYMFSNVCHSAKQESYECCHELLKIISNDCPEDLYSIRGTATEKNILKALKAFEENKIESADKEERLIKAVTRSRKCIKIVGKILAAISKDFSNKCKEEQTELKELIPLLMELTSIFAIIEDTARHNREISKPEGYYKGEVHWNI